MSLRIERELVRDVALVAVPHLCRRLGAGPLGNHKLNVVEPFAGIKPALFRFPAGPGHVGWTTVVARERERRAIAFAEMGLAKIGGHELIYVFGAGVNIRVGA